MDNVVTYFSALDGNIPWDSNPLSNSDTLAKKFSLLMKSIHYSTVIMVYALLQQGLVSGNMYLTSLYYQL